MSRYFTTIIVGGGPAGTGPLINAAQHGELEQLLDYGSGICIVEKTKILCCGSLDKYVINANSLGVAFLECLDNSPENGILTSTKALPLTLELEQYRDATPPLKLIGDYLKTIGEVLEKTLKEHAKSDVLLSSEVKAVRIQHDNTFLVEIEQHVDDGTVNTIVLQAEKVIISTGGKQEKEDLLDRDIVPGLSLNDFRNKVVPSDEVLRTDLSNHTQILLSQWLSNHDPASESPRVVVLGGSHSSWSTSWTLLNKIQHELGIAFHQGSILQYHRSQIKIYYPSPEEAQEEEYPFDPIQDVCPLSNRVNRFGGMRGDARALARRVMGLDKSQEKEERVNLIQLDGEEPITADQLRQVFEEAVVIFPAFGYDANFVPIYKADGSPVSMLRQPGGVVVDNLARIRNDDGSSIPNMFAFGLGSGMFVTEKTGGEPSFQGRADGVWLYQNDVGEIVSQQLTA